MDFFLRLHALSQRFDEQLQRWGGSLLSIGLRFFVGWQFFKAGLIKISDWSATLSLFQDEYKVPVLPPEVAAVLGLFVVNAMAVISYPQLFQFECPAAINDHFYWGISLLVLVMFGPGKFSLDTQLPSRRQ